MESLRVITLYTPGVDVATVSEFLASQEKQRSIVTKVLVEKAETSRVLFNNGMKEVMGNLRKKVLDLNDMDDKVAQILPKSIEVANVDHVDLGGGFNPILAEFGLPQKLKYGTRSELRKNCSRFLRFSYLMDFIATESLANI